MEQYNIQQDKAIQDNTVVNSNNNNQSYQFTQKPLSANGFDTNHSSDPFHAFPTPPPNNSTTTIQHPQVAPNTYPNKENAPIQISSPSQANAQVQTSFQSVPQNTIHSSNVLSPNPPQNNYVPPSQYTPSYNAIHNSGVQSSVQAPTTFRASEGPAISSSSYATPSSTKQSTGTTTRPTTKKVDSESLKNQKFIILALLSSIVITVLIIGLGAALLAPKNTTNKLAKSTQIENGTPQINNQTNSEEVGTGTSTDNDLQIIYGTDSAESIPKETLIEKPKEPSPAVVKKVAVAPAITPKQTALSASNVASTSPSKPPVATSPTSTQYWIQIFSTPNRDKINQIKKELMSQGLTSTIVPKTIDQTLYYRLRVGPYYNKDEGNKFLAWIRKNDNYKDAYISIAQHSTNG